MVNITSKSKTKRLAKGQRTHVRRMKQAARKEANSNSPQPSPKKAARVRKQKDQS